MAKVKIKKLALASVMAGLLGYSLPSYADDTEVYFSSIVNNIKANVLFIIDVSGSMNFTSDYTGTGASGVPTDRTLTRIATVKTSLERILNNDATQGLRIGLMSFANADYIYLRQPIVDIDEIDKDKDIKQTVAGNQTTLEQTVLTDGDDGWEGKIQVDYGPYKTAWVINRKMNDTYGYVQRSKTKITGGDPSIENSVILLQRGAPGSTTSNIAIRFDNILLKSPQSVSLSKSAITKAELKLYGVAEPKGADDIQIYVFVDTQTNSPHLRPDLEANITSRPWGTSVTCTLESPTLGETWHTCDITGLIQNQIGKSDWQDGNAITVRLFPPSNTARALRFYTRETGYPAKLLITADNKLIAKNKKLNKEKILDAAMTLYPQGSTAIVSSFYNASGYISNITDRSSAPGPYHFTSMPLIPGIYPSPVNPASPINKKCQLTHLVLMTDGAPQRDLDAAGQIPPYINQAVNNCKIFTADDKSQTSNDISSGDYACGRALTSWLARTSQSKDTGGEGNYVKTQTIAFALQDQTGISFLKDLAKYGQGNFYDATDADSLVDAFQSILETALGAARPSASGVVAMGAQSGYDQRSEVFYGLYKTSSYDYWPGNVKGFKMGFDDYELPDGSKAQRAVLKDWSGQHYVVATDGSFIDNLSSAWSSDDSGDVTAGGVVGQLAAPNLRAVYTLKSSVGSLNSGTAIALNSSASAISTADLGLTGADNTEDRRKGLLDFIIGYDYVAGGTTSGKAKAADPKIGESANNGVSLLSYGQQCISENKNILSCDFNKLEMVGFYATNDGVLRGYNLVNGKALFEFMPQQMLPVINKLQKKKALNDKSVKTYGLDTRVVISHNDINQNGIVDGTEKAYAIVASGRGGRYIYGIDITNKSSPKLVWYIDNSTPGFSQLANTWSVPLAGTIKVGTTSTPVIVFGGGYNTAQDGGTNYKGTTVPQMQDNVGNAIYVVNVQTGQLLWSTSSGMQYSIPGQVAALTNNEGFMTDIFFGDMGGQIWRFEVNNGSTGTGLLTAGSGQGGLVASISGSGASDTRRFYQTPMLYKIPNTNLVSVNLGSGYKAHPLVKDNTDRFYSFRFPLEANPQSNEVVKEDMMGVLDPLDTKNGPSNVEHGFMLKLDNTRGEKVISNAFADFDRLVFNTYIPDTGNITQDNCVISKVGTQRTYYFSLATGKSLLETGYTEVYPATLPLDSVAYCNDGFCSVISSMDMLSKKDVPGSSIIPRGSTIQKTTWTDLFDPN